MKYSKIEESIHRDLEKLTYRELEEEAKRRKIRVYPKLYKSNEVDFLHNGLGLLTDCISCVISEEINGIVTLDMEYLSHDKKGLYKDLVEGNIIKAPTGDKRLNQLFRIERVVKTSDSIKVYAKHIFFTDLGNGFIKDTYIKDKNRVEALQQILGNTIDNHSFTGDGNATVDLKNLRIVRRSPVSAILGDEDNSLINRYSGEILLNNYKISILDNIGESNNVLVAYRKNITGVELSVDISDLITRVIPVGSNGLLLPEYFIDSPKIKDYSIIYNREVSFSDIGEKEADSETGEEAVSKEEAYSLLRKAVADMYSLQKVDTPKFDLKVDMVDVTKTVEYENYKSLEVVALGDTVIVRHKLINLDLTGRVYSRKYDCLTAMNTEISLGFKPQSLANIFNKTNTNVTNLANSVKETVEKVSATGTDIENINSNISTINTNLSNVRKDVVDLTFRTDGIDKKVSNLDIVTSKLSKDIGNLDNLNTSNNEDLVQAINEVMSLIGTGGGGGGSSDYYRVILPINTTTINIKYPEIYSTFKCEYDLTVTSISIPSHLTGLEDLEMRVTNTTTNKIYNPAIVGGVATVIIPLKSADVLKVSLKSSASLIPYSDSKFSGDRGLSYISSHFVGFGDYELWSLGVVIKFK